MSNTKKLWIVIISLILVVCVSGGATLAYLYAKTPEVENSFTPVFVDCEVVEEFSGTTKSNVAVKNTGDITAYVRATFVVMWVADDGTVYGVAPREGVDYSIELGSPAWMLGSDGFYYYSMPVVSLATTEALINTLTLISEAPDGYKLTVHVAATAIQSEPAAAVEDAWGATLQPDGALVAP